MTQNALACAVLVVGLLNGAPAVAQEIRFWGLIQGAEEHGVIEQHGQQFSVREGDNIPGQGTVHKLTPDVLIIRKVLTEEDKERARAEGGIVVDVKEQHISNVLHLIAPVPVR